MLAPTELFPEVPNLYEFPSVHAGMLFDEVRVGKYSEAIRQVVKKGDVVADIGTGTGLLAFLCLKAGASRVHAIERSPAGKCAKVVAEKNGFSDRIIFHSQDSRSCSLQEKVNVVVSELIGHIEHLKGTKTFCDKMNKTRDEKAKATGKREDMGSNTKDGESQGDSE